MGIPMKRFFRILQHQSRVPCPFHGIRPWSPSRTCYSTTPSSAPRGPPTLRPILCASPSRLLTTLPTPESGQGNDANDKEPPSPAPARAPSATRASTDSDAVRQRALKVYEKLLMQPCLGCGAPFQNTDPTQAGYLELKRVLERAEKLKGRWMPLEHPPPRTLSPETQALADVLQDIVPTSDPASESTPAPAASAAEAEQKPRQREDDPLRGRSSSPHQLVCQRCHDIHHRRRTSILAPLRTHPRHLQLMQYGRNLFVQMVDVLDFPLNFFPVAHMLPKDSVHFIVFNKTDLLPLTLPEDHLQKWIRTVTTEACLKNKTRVPHEILAISSKSGAGIRELFELIQAYRRKVRVNDVIIFGSTNVGKSEFFNCLHRMVRYPKQATPHVTSAPIHGTTVAPIRFPLARFAGLLRLNTSQVDADLIDTPGIAAPLLTAALPPESSLRPWHFSKRIVPESFRVPVGTSLFLGSLARVDVLANEHAAESLRSNNNLILTVWAPPHLPLHVTNVAKAARFCATTLPATLLPHAPPQASFARALALRLPRCAGPRTHCTEIVFGGSGFIGVGGDFRNALFEVHTVGGHGVALRAPLLPYEFSTRIHRVQGPSAANLEQLQLDNAETVDPEGEGQNVPAEFVDMVEEK